MFQVVVTFRIDYNCGLFHVLLFMNEPTRFVSVQLTTNFIALSIADIPLYVHYIFGPASIFGCHTP